MIDTSEKCDDKLIEFDINANTADTTVSSTDEKTCGSMDSNASSSNDPRRSCSFSSVIVHEHEVILGDNPCAYGPSLSLGWTRVSTKTIPIVDYENSKKYTRSHKQLMLPRYVRERILLDYGVSRSEMNEAIEEGISVRKQRQETVNNYYFWKQLRQILRSCFPCIQKKKGLEESKQLNAK
eukprot:CAMPEP_0116068460 /NCGR_PEP_ID=MMETSP0322-20121206/11672_1 /TAXON_ID=163516 /ORGANISM="Leptocylindrus danicus var. apora, Strain B651" /LENGTH=180 /DNA_ID=CAMNT_0003555571 /DNA_START=636 /DNA_END=1178 /DNA_ORIENTATION=+